MNCIILFYLFSYHTENKCFNFTIIEKDQAIAAMKLIYGEAGKAIRHRDKKFGHNL